MDKESLQEFVIAKLDFFSKLPLNSVLYKWRYEDDKRIIIHPEKMFPLNSFWRIRAELEKSDEDYQANKYKYDFLFGYLAKAKTFAYNSEIFDELYDEYSYFQRTGKYIFRNIALLKGCYLENDQFFEIDGVNIGFNYEYMDFFSWILDDLKYEIFDFSSYQSPLKIYMSPFNSKNAIIEFKEIATTPQMLKDELNEKVKNIAKAILIKNGVCKQFEITPILTFSYLYQNSDICKVSYVHDYVFNIGSSGFKLKNLDDVKNLYFKIKNLRNFDTNSLTIQRFISAENKTKLDDKLLDLMIALESLYDSIQDELSFRISLYTTVFLQKDKEFFNRIKELYKLRSKIVHGMYVEQGILEESVYFADEVVRNCIVKCIELDIDKRDIEKLVFERLFSQ